MKIILGLMLIAFVVSVSSASSPDVRSSEYSCQQLQQMLAAKSSLHILYGPGSWGETHQWDSATCAPKIAHAAFVPTNDKWFCQMGFVCEPWPHPD
jgi:hypothetical protein